MSGRRLILEWWLLLLGACALAAWLIASGQSARLDARLLDIATALVGKAPSDDVMIVAIDEASLAQTGAWPWPRANHARLIDWIDAAGAERIVYDILFVEPTTAADDLALAQAIARSGKVVLPHSFVAKPNTGGGLVPELPLPDIAAGAQAIGHVAAEPDSDGTLRRFLTNQQASDGSFPHLVSAMLAPAGSGKGLGVARPIVPFLAAGAVPQISASSVLAGEVDPAFLRGRTVFVGATAMGMGDRYVVPGGGSGSMAGVEAQANFFLAARDGRLIAEADRLWSVILGWSAIGLLFVAFWLLDPQRGLFATLGIAFAALSLALGLVPLVHIWIAPGAALVVLLLAYPLWSWRRLSTVSAYLGKEAERMLPTAGKVRPGAGFDVVARQVDRMRSLVSNVNDSFAFMRRVIELAPDAIMVLDHKGMLQMMNRRAGELFPGWKSDRDSPVLEEMLLYVGAKLDREHGELATASGQTFLVARAKFELTGDHGTGEIVALRDISPIRQRDIERKQMLEFLSHDMRTPQVAIIGLADRGKDAGAPRESFRRIRAQAERTLKLADDFVQIARLEEAAIVREDTDLVALVEEACDRLYEQAQKARMEICQQLPDSPVFATVDPSLIARMLDNLLGNAIKYAPAGSPVSVSLVENADGSIEIEVADKGPGLPLERLDDPFARFGAHETKAGPSAGLGLAFVKRAVELHHGTIIVRSAPGKGTRFAITLPLGVADQAG